MISTVNNRKPTLLLNTCSSLSQLFYLSSYIDAPAGDRSTIQTSGNEAYRAVRETGRSDADSHNTSPCTSSHSSLNTDGDVESFYE